MGLRLSEADLARLKCRLIGSCESIEVALDGLGLTADPACGRRSAFGQPKR